MTKPTRIVLITTGILIAAAILIVSSGPDILDMTKTRNGRTPEVIDMGGLTKKAPLPDLGFDMPPFQGITRWWNTPGNAPLTPESLRGKVVLVKFWTYSCINCIRTYPFIRRWHELYADDGFVLIGVHTPEFTFEAKPENVEREIGENGFTFPVALDPDYKTWRAYDNRFWPASYLFDKQGRLRYTHFGEGKYDVSEQAIRDLLMEDGGAITKAEMPMPEEAVDFSMIKTRETYFGYERAENLSNALEVVIDANADYELKTVGINQWSIGGPWRIEGERAVALAPEMRTGDVMIDAEGNAVLEVGLSDLYRIVNLPDGKRHVVELEIIEGEVRFYAATFG
jgi:thiol-disulfide isomerase/thioredoxin